MLSSFRRFYRGLSSALGVLLFPLGRFGKIGGNPSTPERLSAGLVIVLPGIEGRSFLNRSLIRGLIDGGVHSAVQIWDWTSGIVLLFAFHLRSRWLQRSSALRFAARIVEYQKRYPGRPVQLIGHSGGAGLALFILEALPDDCEAVSAILLGAALSPRYDFVPALRRTRRGIVNFYSPYDALFLGAATVVLGTMDGRHSPAAGAIGFRESPADEQSAGPVSPKLRQLRFRGSMLGQFHCGGHFGWTNRVFAAETLAPLVCEFEAD